ncbi:MAG TPA: MMPL family transporter [Thermoanaerobaculia bacterium]|nr:MMPL family transporter [Thermoanaerobaculia bacterium]
MTRFLRRWAEWAVSRPRLAIGTVAALTLLAAPGLLRLRVRTDGRSLAPPGDHAVLFDAEVHDHFGLRDPIIVLIETGDPAGIYNPATLTRLRDLDAALAKLPGIGPQNVISLATERRDRLYPNSLVFRPFLDPLPATPRLLALLRSDVEAMQILKGTLVAADGHAAAILVGVEFVRGQDLAATDRTTIYRQIAGTAKAFATPADRIYVVGAPVAEALLGSYLDRDLRLMLPLAIALIAAVMWLGCRRPWGVVIGLGEVACCLVCTFGLMGWAGVPIYLTTYLLPVIVTTVGVADEIHLMWRYQGVLARTSPGEAHPAAVRTTLREVMRPVALSSLAALVAFASFLSSAIDPVRFFGLFAAFGMLVCIVYALTVVPAALALLPPDALRHPGSPGRTATPLVRLTAPLLSRPGATLAALGLATLALGAGISRLYVQDSWIGSFAPGSPLRVATDRVDSRMNGTHILLAHLAFDGPATRSPRVLSRQGPLLDPGALDAIGRFEGFIASQPQVGGVLGPYGQLATVAYLWNGRRPGTRAIPRDPEHVDRLLRFLDRIRGRRRRLETIDSDLRRTLITIFLKHANYRETAGLMSALRRYEREQLAPLGARLDFAGDVAVSQAMIPAIVSSQVASLALALAGSFAAVWILYRSLWVAVCCSLPSALAALWIFGTMGWAGIPLGVATSMFSAITLGIGVDYAVHFMERYLAAAEGADPVRYAIRIVGPEIAADTLAVSLGFGLLALSQVPTIARLGLLVCVALLASCLLTLLGLGALLALSRRRTLDPRLAL